MIEIVYSFVKNELFCYTSFFFIKKENYDADKNVRFMNMIIYIKKN